MASVTYQSLERRVRAMLFDTRPSDYAFDPDTILFALDRANAALFARLNTPPALVTSFLTLVANDYDYALGNTYDDTDALSGFRLLSSGKPITKYDMPVWQSFRDGNPVQTGDPLVIAFSESGGGDLTAYLWPTPSKADTVEAVFQAGFSGSDPSFRSIGRDTYDASVDYPGKSVWAAVYHTAMELAAAASAEKLARLGLDKSVAKLYEQQYESAIQGELDREHRLRRPGQPVTRNPF